MEPTTIDDDTQPSATSARSPASTSEPTLSVLHLALDTHASRMIATTIPISTNTMIATCTQIHIGGIAPAYCAPGAHAARAGSRATIVL